jgi:hypothetical protein
MVEGNNTVATATRPPVVPVFSMTSSPSSVPQQVPVPVVVVVEEETATSTSTSSPSSTPVQQVAAPVSQQPVIVAATDITPSTTTIDNGTSNGGDNSDNNNSNNSRMIPVIKDTDTIQGIIKIIRRQIELLIFDDDTLIGSVSNEKYIQWYLNETNRIERNFKSHHCLSFFTFRNKIKTTNVT